jgi:hypothetical protein
MKRISIFTLIIVIIFVAIAWGKISSKGSWSTTSSTDKTTTLVPTLDLAVGTLRLEGTSQAVDKELASELLPYWQLMDELNASESTAPQEITAVVENIQGVMTAEQVKAIKEMKLTQNDLAITMQDGGSAVSTGTTTKINNIAQVSGGGGALGAPPDGGGILLDGGGPGGGVISSTNSQSNSSTNTTSLIEQVIKLLEKRINS